MSCFEKKSTPDTRPRHKMTNDRDPLAPKPPRPRAVRYHGLFGMTIVPQHMIVDERWSPDSLIDMHRAMNALLKSRVNYKKFETKCARTRLLNLSKSLKLDCIYGRLKLKNIMSGNSAHQIHNFFIKHREMQRLYQRMPIHLVLESVSQRSFAMRKERDRLQCRLQQLKLKYKVLLLERSKLENRLNYQDEKMVEEEMTIRVLLKKIENSKVRTNAIHVINTTYKKMRQLLLHDEIFYEHVLRSLDEDIEEQKAFIKYILHLGMPAIATFREVNKDVMQLQVKSQMDLKSKMDFLNSVKKSKVYREHKLKIKEILTANPKRYIRHTDSMVILKNELETIESTIKNLKRQVFASQAVEIYPRFKNLVEKNQRMIREVALGSQSLEMRMTKLKGSTLLSEVLVHNLSTEEVNRLELIEKLKKELKTELQIEDKHCEYMKNRADAFVMMRLTLWNLFSMLNNIGPHTPIVGRIYKSSALRLPLLKFELFDIRALPPEPFTEDITLIMHVVKRRIYNLMTAFKPKMMDSIHESREKYHAEFLSAACSRTLSLQSNVVPLDLLLDKSYATIPNRQQIKARSAKIVEERSKRD